MVMGFRERRLGCRLYVDRQSDANILKKLDRMLVDGSFSNQTELIKRGIELAYQEVYGEAEEVRASYKQEIDVKKLAEEVARALKPEMEKLMAECEARVILGTWYREKGVPAYMIMRQGMLRMKTIGLWLKIPMKRLWIRNCLTR